MLSERRIEFIRLYGKKLFSAEGVKKILTEPAHVGDVAYKVAKSFVFDVNLRNQKQDQNIFQDSIAALCRIANFLNGDASVSFDKWLPVSTGRDVSDLGDLLRQHGSDKSTLHDYHRIYGSVLRRDGPCNILEIGLGTNNLDAIGNMGIWGKPGASLRAFRDWAPNSRVYGADIDRRILFQEEKISTFWADQTNLRTLDDLAAQLSGIEFDLIIDDGLHLPHANLNTLCALLPSLSKSGILVIEDISPNTPEIGDIWHITAKILKPKYESYFVKMKSSWVFVVRWAK